MMRKTKRKVKDYIGIITIVLGISGIVLALLLFSGVF